MGRRSVHCPCGADFLIPEVPPSRLHCPKCGDPVKFSVDDAGSTRVREDIRERPIKPLPPRNPYYPLILLGAGGLVIAGGLVGLIIHFTSRKPPLSIEERFVVKPKREPEP